MSCSPTTTPAPDPTCTFSIAPARRTRRVTLAGADAVDWEDIAAQNGVLYVGDIGDNAAQRPEIVVYRLPEPGAAGEVEAERIVLRYADGPHDAEALFIDPVEQQLVIVTKALDGNSGVYATPLDTPATLERVADLSLGAAQLVTAGDISAAGAVIALRTYGTVFVWDRQEGETIAEAFAREPCQAPERDRDPGRSARARTRRARVRHHFRRAKPGDLGDHGQRWVSRIRVRAGIPYLFVPCAQHALVCARS